MPHSVKPQIRQKWRPPLALVLGGTLAGILAVPAIGIGYFKVAGFILGWGETTLMLFGLAVLVTTILGYLVWRLVLRPVYALTVHANAVKQGKASTALPDHFGTPELTALGQAVLQMETTLQDREAGLRAYTDHVTHELKSPLTSIIGAAELLRGNPDAPDQRVLLETILNSSLKMQDQLDALRRLAKAREPLGHGPCRLSKAVHNVESSVTLSLAGDIELPIDLEALQVLLTHLSQNASEHGATSVDIHTTQNGFVFVDNGSGIGPGNATRIFEPFFTTRREDGGTGMGLAIVRNMLQAVGGEIALVQKDLGAGFDISFP